MKKDQVRFSMVTQHNLKLHQTGHGDFTKQLVVVVTVNDHSYLFAGNHP